MCDTTAVRNTPASIPHHIYRFPRLPPATTVFGAAPLSPSTPSNYHPATTGLHGARGGYSWSAAPRSSSACALRPSLCRPSVFLVYTRRMSTPHARRPACMALHVVRIRIPKRLSSRTRDVPPRRNCLQARRAAPPAAFPSPRQSTPRWSVMCTIRRDYQRRRLSQGTVYSTPTTLRATGHATTNPLRAESDVLRHCDATSCAL
jgi:hypothetical protein